MVKLIDQIKDKQRSILDAFGVKKTKSEETAVVEAAAAAAADDDDVVGSTESANTLKQNTVSFATPPIMDTNLLTPDGGMRDFGKRFFFINE